MKNNPLDGYQPDTEQTGGGYADSPTHYPTCRYCGKQTLPVEKYASAEAANEAATLKCDCEKAREYQAEVKRAEEREKNIKKLRKALEDIRPYFTKERGTEYTDALYDLLFNCGVAILDEQVAKANINCGRVKVALSTNSKGAIVIALTYSDGARVEV